MRLAYWLVGAVLGAFSALAITSLIYSFRDPDFYLNFDLIRNGTIPGLAVGLIVADYAWHRHRQVPPQDVSRRRKLIVAWILAPIVSSVAMLGASMAVSRAVSSPPSDAAMAVEFNHNRLAFSEIARHLEGDSAVSRTPYEDDMKRLGLSEDDGEPFLRYWSYESKGPLYSDFTHKGFYFSRKTPSSTGNCLPNGDECNPVVFRHISGNWYTYTLDIPG